MDDTLLNTDATIDWLFALSTRCEFAALHCVLELMDELFPVTQKNPIDSIGHLQDIISQNDLVCECGPAVTLVMTTSIVQAIEVMLADSSKAIPHLMSMMGSYE